MPEWQEVAQKVDRIYTALFGIEGQENTGRIPVLETRTNDHAKRIGSLEKWRSWMLGLGFAVGLLIGYVVHLAK